MQNFVALDFETANRNPSSVCSIGLVFVVDGQLADSYYRLIKPIPDYYSAFNTGIHGITAADTRRASRFPDIWQEVLPKIAGLRWSRTTARLTPAACARCSRLTTCRRRKTPSTAPAARRAKPSPNCPTTSSLPLPATSASRLTATTMPSPMPKPAPASPCASSPTTPAKTNGTNHPFHRG